MPDIVQLFGVTTVIFGIASLLLISRAKNRLTDGSIKKYMGNFEVCLAFIVVFSLWQTIRSILHVNVDIGGFLTYPEYIFLVFAYIGFILSSYRVLKIGKEFGFKDDGKKIAGIINGSPKNTIKPGDDVKAHNSKNPLPEKRKKKKSRR